MHVISKKSAWYESDLYEGKTVYDNNAFFLEETHVLCIHSFGMIDD